MNMNPFPSPPPPPPPPHLQFDGDVLYTFQDNPIAPPSPTPKQGGDTQYDANEPPPLSTTNKSLTNTTRRSVEHCTPHADGAWLNELGWSQ